MLKSRSTDRHPHKRTSEALARAVWGLLFLVFLRVLKLIVERSYNPEKARTGTERTLAVLGPGSRFRILDCRLQGFRV